MTDDAPDPEQGEVSAPDLGALLDAAMAAPAREIAATAHEGGISTASCPQKYKCSDNRLYAVKFKQNNHGDGKAIFNEHAVAVLGGLVGAPVAAVEIVRVSQALCDELNANAAAHNLNFQAAAGLHHGSRWQEHKSGAQQIAHLDENRESLGALDVLYAWAMCSGDQQLIYDNDAPFAVLSVDHSPFFPGGSSWTSESLAGQQGSIVRDPMFSAAQLTPQDRTTALDKLANATPEQVAAAVGRPPAEWGVDRAERLALAEYLLARKDGVLALLS